MPSWHVRYNEERGQEGDFWYHLFFCDRNKAAVSQLEKYTVIIVYYKNCIMPMQVIFFPPEKKKNLFSLWLLPHPQLKNDHITRPPAVRTLPKPCVMHRWAERRSPAGQRKSRPPTRARGPRASQLLSEASSALLPGSVLLIGRQPREVDLHGIDVPVLVERHGNLVRQVVLRVIHGPRLMEERAVSHGDS